MAKTPTGSGAGKGSTRARAKAKPSAKPTAKSVAPKSAAKKSAKPQAKPASGAGAKAKQPSPEEILQNLNQRAASAGAKVEAQAAQAQAEAAAKLGGDKVAVLGNAVWLLTQTSTHKHLFITDLEWLVLPAIALNQFRLWRRGTVPVAFATWAYLSDDAEARLKEGVRRIAPMDWKSGDNLWLMDLICPFGGQDEAMKELKEKAFKGKTVKTLQPAPGGEGMAVVEW